MNDPDDYLSKETLKRLKRSERDIKAGRLYTLEEVKKELGLDGKCSKR